MAGVCVCGCGFNTTGGQLCPDWKAFGLKNGATSVTGIDISFSPTDGFTLIQFVRLQYCNDTCHDQMVSVSALIPYVNFNQDGVNYWDFAVFAGAQLDVPPDQSTFSLNVAGRVRESNVSASLTRLSVPARTADQLFLVPAGRCLYMIGSTWRAIYQNSGGGSNGWDYSRLELNYRAYPVGA